MAAGDSSVDRVSAYTDAVFAVVVTIMVLELRAPESADLAALLTLWPTGVSYLVSYVFIAIIWINHHHLMRFARRPTLPLLWINFVHLFFISLLPFATSWIARTDLAAGPMIVYAGLFVCIDATYNVFERYVLRNTDQITEGGLRVARRRSLIALGFFSCAAAASGLVPWLGFVLICLALLLHFRPDVGWRPR